jgi:hypothetical protein
MIPLDTETKYGKVAAVACFGGERYYFFVKAETTSMLPASVVEPEYEQDKEE